ncbi:MAG TPA: hypothetical protein VGC81_13305 [Candidatus Methylomirabilis sp.]
MTVEGWIKVYRQIRDHWLWERDRFTRGQAWLDLLLRARHKDHEARIGNQFVTEKRGQALVFQRQLASQWGWNRETVSKFLRLLKADHMVSLETSHGPEGGYTLITIMNYERYQGSDESENEYESSHASGHATSHDPATLPAIYKNVKNEKKERTPFDEGAFWEKFSPQDQETIRQTIRALHSTRKGGKVADSVIQAEMRWWDQRDPVQVVEGMRTYLQKDYAAQGKREPYLRGIIRNLDGQPPPSSRQASPEIGPRGGHPAIRRAALSMTEEDVSG